MVSFPDDSSVLVLVDGFEQTYRKTEVIRIDPVEREEFARNVDRLNFTPTDRKKQGDHTSRKNLLKTNVRPSNVVDLHMEELRNEYSDMTSGEKLEAQLRYFSGKLEEAIRLRKKNLIVIHGVGKGRLRDEVRLILDDYPNITYSDASYETYGYGATEVFIE